MKELALAVSFALCAAVFAEPLPTCGDWRFTAGAERKGEILRVALTNAASGVAGGFVPVDLARVPALDAGVEFSVKARGSGIAKPAEHYLGYKFMLKLRNRSTGVCIWPGAGGRSGSFPWTTSTFRLSRETLDGAPGDYEAELMLGLQKTTGVVEFDLSTLAVFPVAPIAPLVNQDLVCAYTPAAARAPRGRGVMSPGRDMTDADFATLAEWGATLLRFQINRGWDAVDANQDLAEYDRWLETRLDNLERVVLPNCARCGMRVVVDLHALPGGRDAAREMNMFYDRRYAGHFVACWRKIARRFRARPEIAGFDLVNEPVQTRTAVPGCDYWTLQLRAAEAIREIDPETPVIVESNTWDAADGFARLSPLALTNIVYEVHMYEPFAFTHQGVGRARPDGTFDRRRYPDARAGWDKAFVRRRFEPVRRFQLKHRARIYVGEFSAIAWAEGAESYLRDVIDLCEEYGWDWTYHAFREWQGWSVEHEGRDARSLVPSGDNPRKRALLEGFRR